MSTLPSNALVSRKEVKDYLEITAENNTLDNLINDLIGRVSSAFEGYCGRTFKAADHTDYYDGDGCNKLFMDSYPVSAVSSLHDDPDWVWGSDTLIAASDYRIFDERGIVLNGGRFGSNVQNIKVVYRAGYATIPTDLKQACIEEVGRKVKHRTDYDEIAKTLTDGSVQYSDKGLLPQTILTLSRYRQKVVY